jgi:hypothetical protein
MCVFVCRTKLTPRCKFYPETFRSLQLAQKFPAFYETRSPCQLSLSWTRSIQSKTPHLNAWRSILILSSLLRRGLPSFTSNSGPSAKSYYSTRCTKIQGVIIWVVLCKNCYIHIWLIINHLTAKNILLYKDILRLQFLRTIFTYTAATSGKTTPTYFILVLVHRSGLRGQQILHPLTTRGAYDRHCLPAKSQTIKSFCSEQWSPLTA